MCRPRAVPGSTTAVFTNKRARARTHTHTQWELDTHCKVVEVARYDVTARTFQKQGIDPAGAKFI